ncbi:hypothetical protein HN858_04690 [Candidatus Falkowbacteria bacterium]|jgi:hypothetical protein|nr:hypothetical protein [Candidatus Falkowbacteria bacterium]MBT6574452.1 hypothetical protein [Candidatus Falkowbacteria bacterium]MBT7348938.1 hypothetical protein [Candidatus Falkowbacteria bacterium]MBT7500335.1 hypothetical protein [Candidatus Falkowbacteria bacterium]
MTTRKIQRARDVIDLLKAHMLQANQPERDAETQAFIEKLERQIKELEEVAGRTIQLSSDNEALTRDLEKLTAQVDESTIHLQIWENTAEATEEILAIRALAREEVTIKLLSKNQVTMIFHKDGSIDLWDHQEGDLFKWLQPNDHIKIGDARLIQAADTVCDWETVDFVHDE